MEDNYFARLNSINVNDKVEKKNNLSYLSWAWAWAEVKKIYPDAIYKIYENNNGWNYFTDGRTAWVKTGVTINNIEHIEYLPVMDFRNKSILLENITSFDVNKTIQRSLTKACARHGLGLYIYAGEDLPEENSGNVQDFEKSAKAEKASQTRALNKTVRSGQPYQEPQKKPLEERYFAALEYLRNTEKLEKRSVVDSVNSLLNDLREAEKEDWLQNIMLEFDRLTKIDDSIPEFDNNNDPLNDFVPVHNYRV